jgi:rare lipoprotein A
LSLTNKFRLAGCSIVALIMLSVPGITSHLPVGLPEPSFTPVPQNIGALDSPAPAPHPKKKLSFLQRASSFGVASWYGAVLNGHKTASGETFDMNQMTAAHRTLPFGTMVRVVDLHSGKSVVVKINDRGVLFPERVIDLSRGAAEQLGIRKSGVTNVRLDVLNKKQAAAVQVAAAKAPETASGPTGQ